MNAAKTRAPLLPDAAHILVVDDDEGLLHLLKMRLSAMGFAVTPCINGQDAVAAAKKRMFDLAITDLRLRGEDGLDVTEELLRILPGLPIIILTAHGSIPNAVEALQERAILDGRGPISNPFVKDEVGNFFLPEGQKHLLYWVFYH